MQTPKLSTGSKAAAALCFALTAILAIGAFNLTRYRFVMSRGGSMQPALPNLSDAIVDRKAPCALGDVAVMKGAPRYVNVAGTVWVESTEEKAIMHRVLKVNSTTIITKGDANEWREVWPRTAYTGSCVAILPGGTFITTAIIAIGAGATGLGNIALRERRSAK